MELFRFGIECGCSIVFLKGELHTNIVDKLAKRKGRIPWKDNI